MYARGKNCLAKVGELFSPLGERSRWKIIRPLFQEVGAGLRICIFPAIGELKVKNGQGNSTPKIPREIPVLPYEITFSALGESDSRFKNESVGSRDGQIEKVAKQIVALHLLALPKNST